jgi:Flp pilus assembly protein TadD
VENPVRRKQWLTMSLAVLATTALCPRVHGGDLKITIPRRSQLTPVQRLNREGVEAVRKHNYTKAQQLFYKAYLFDPDDPFTLNNLGYVSELQGQVDRAQRYYALAAEQATDAVIDQASTKELQGQSMKQALAVTDRPLEINHANVEAVRLLSQGRAAEADLLLQKTLQADANNVFTINNLGVAKEMEGEMQEALKYYDQASNMHSDAPAVVTVNRNWRGRPISEIAAESARALRKRLVNENDLAQRVAELNLRGVSAVNRNDLQSADADFRKAYTLDPNNAFTLNNVGYVAEIEGDRETAQFFYERAQEAGGAVRTVGLATRRDAEGQKLLAVAADSDTRVDTKISQERTALRQEHEPIVLRRRDHSVVDEPTQPAAPTPATQPNSSQPNPQ